MSIATVKSAITSVLNTVPNVAVFSYEPKAFPSLPAITVNYISMEQRRASFRGFGQSPKHEITYTFQLRLYVGMGNDNEAAIERVESLVDQYITAFRQDLSLGGVVQSADITAGELQAVTDVQNPYYLHTFTLVVVEAEQ